MKVLLDECVPSPLQKLLPGHQCTTVQRQGWTGLKNGALLSAAEAQFEVFITCDQNLQYQQNLGGRKIAIVELSTNDLKRIKSAISLIEAAVSNIGPGEFRRVRVL